MKAIFGIGYGGFQSTAQNSKTAISPILRKRSEMSGCRMNDLARLSQPAFNRIKRFRLMLLFQRILRKAAGSKSSILTSPNTLSSITEH